MSKRRLARFWHDIKAWWAAEMHPPKVWRAKCARCGEDLEADGFLVLDSKEVCLDCVFEGRGVNLRAKEPKDVLPDLSIHRFDAERAVWPGRVN